MIAPYLAGYIAMNPGLFVFWVGGFFGLHL
jgi:hypothetical protein